MKVTKKQLIELLGKKISNSMLKNALEQIKEGLERKLKENDFDMDDFFFSDAEAAARADMQQHYGDSMVHAKLGDKEDAKTWIQSQLDANDSEVNKHASHLRKAEKQTFNQELVDFISKDPRLAELRNNDPRALLDLIGLAAYKYVMDNNSSSPFIAALQEWLVELNHEFEPTDEDLLEADPRVYRLLSKYEPIYNKNMQVKRLNEALTFLKNEQVARYYSIVFLQGEEANETMQIMDEQGNEAALAHLLQNYYDQDELKALDDDRYKGNLDHEFRQEIDGNTYIMIWNNGIPYVGLVEMRMVDAPDFSDDQYKDLYDGLHGSYGELGEGGASKTYEYHINLDERGLFYADVRDENDKSVYWIKIGYGEDKDNNPMEDGFMRHTRDIQGLEAHLRDVGVIGKNDKIVSPYSEGIQEDVDDMDIDNGQLGDDPMSLDTMSTINDVQKGYYVVPPKGNDPLWYVVDQDGDPVEGYNTEEEANAAIPGLESSFRPSGGLAPDSEELGVDFKESRLARIDRLMNEAFALIKEYRGMGSYPAGDMSNAPWTIEDPKPMRRKPKTVFTLTDSNEECLILHHGGSYYAFHKDSIDPNEVSSIAIDYVGVPSEVERDEDGYNTIHDTSQYSSARYLPDEAVVDYINDNYAHMKIGDGLDAWENGSYDLVRIDQPLAKDLKATWHNLSIPIS